MTDMTFNEYIWFYGSLFLLIGIGAVLIDQRWPDTIPSQFYCTHLALGATTLFVGVFNGLWNFVSWVIHLFN